MINQIKESYLSGKSIKCLLKDHNLTRNEFYYLRKKMGWTRNNMIKYKHKQLNYFEEIDTADKQYLLGLIAADGNIDRGYAIRITLKEEDMSILKKYAKIILGSETFLSYNKGTRRKNSYTLKISGKKTCLDLLKWGITQDKTFTLDIPLENLDDEAFKLFMLGLSDGDGSIFTKSSGKYRYLNFKLINSQTLCDKIAKRVNRLLGITFSREIVKCSNNRNVISLRLQKQGEVLRFLEWLYSTKIGCLERKKRKFEEFVISP